jgi:hypothetical protein
VSVTLPDLRRIDWIPLGRAIITVADLDDAGSDPQSELLEWVTTWAATSCPADVDGLEETISAVIAGGIAVGTDGTVYLQVSRLTTAIYSIAGDRPSRSDVLHRLQRDRFACRELDYKPEGRATPSDKRKRVRVFVSPKGYVLREQ